MIQYYSFNEKDKELFKKTFFRHLKENGLYYSVIKNFFGKRRMTFDYYFFCLNSGCYLFNGAIDVIWKIINSSTGSRIKASIFLMDLLSDKNIEYIVKRKHSEIKERLFDALIVELNYLASEDVIKTLDESDLIKINYYIEKVDKYKSGRCNSLKEIIKNVQLSVL
jgi:hypothetical protein